MKSMHRQLAGDLYRALANDDTLEDGDRNIVLQALRDVPDGAKLPLGDYGDTDISWDNPPALNIVIAADYYGIQVLHDEHRS